MDDPRNELQAINELRRLIVLHEERLVRLGLEQGVSWDAMALYLGVRRQTLHQRWAKVIRTRPPPPAEERADFRGFYRTDDNGDWYRSL